MPWFRSRRARLALRVKKGSACRFWEEKGKACSNVVRLLPTGSFRQHAIEVNGMESYKMLGLIIASSVGFAFPLEKSDTAGRWSVKVVSKSYYRYKGKVRAFALRV